MEDVDEEGGHAAHTGTLKKVMYVYTGPDGLL
jgi:hypothetical protein